MAPNEADKEKNFFTLKCIEDIGDKWSIRV